MNETDKNDEPQGGSSRGPLVALIVVVVLVVGGLWLSQRLQSMSSTQDCAMAGRNNCAPAR